MDQKMAEAFQKVRDITVKIKDCIRIRVHCEIFAEKFLSFHLLSSGFCMYNNIMLTDGSLEIN